MYSLRNLLQIPLVISAMEEYVPAYADFHVGLNYSKIEGLISCVIFKTLLKVRDAF